MNNNTDFFLWKMSYGVVKCKKGDPSGFITIYSVAKYQKARGGAFETLKNFRKKPHSSEKKSKRGPYRLVQFCRLR